MLCAEVSDRLSDIGVIQMPISVFPIPRLREAECLLNVQLLLLMLRCWSRRTLFLTTKYPFSNSCPSSYQRIYRHMIMAEAMPALSREDRETYARMGTTMERFHNNFRNTWKLLYEACSSGKRPANMSIRQFLNTGSEFAHHLTMHHTIGMPFPEGNRFSTATNLACRRTTHLSRTCAENASF